MLKKLGEKKLWQRVIIAAFVFLVVTPCVLLYRRITEVKTTFTVLRRNRGKWSEEEMELLSKNLNAQVDSEPLHHPNVLIIVDEFGLNEVRNALNGIKITEKSGEFKMRNSSVKFRDFSYELIVGWRNKKLPFRPVLYEKVDWPAIVHWHSPEMNKPYNMTGIKGEEEKIDK
jgi:hypothetical protein